MDVLVYATLVCGLVAHAVSLARWLIGRVRSRRRPKTARSGFERRQTVISLPRGIERRSGIDRRALAA
jgi:hypothetical protein